MDSRAIALAKRPELMNVAALMYKANMRRYVKDPKLRRKLTPPYKPGCKRILISDNFYQAVADPKCELITDGIERITGDGIVPSTAPSTRSTRSSARPVSTSPTRTPTSTSRVQAARTSAIDGTAKA